MPQGFTSPSDTSGQIDFEVIANPYPSYEQLRTRDPVHWNPETPARDLTRYADVEMAYWERRNNPIFLGLESLPVVFETAGR